MGIYTRRDAMDMASLQDKVLVYYLDPLSF